MANRAYLYATDDVDQWNADQGEHAVYYDSRETIPVAWWFLFTPDDVKLIALEQDQEVRIQTERREALERFEAARPILDRLIGGRLDGRRVDLFLAVIRAWNGRYLAMDPSEVFFILDPADGPDRHLWFRRILSLAQEQPFNTAVFKAETCSLSPIDEVETDKIEVRFVGHTYGELANELWGSIVDR